MANLGRIPRTVTDSVSHWVRRDWVSERVTVTEWVTSGSAVPRWLSVSLTHSSHCHCVRLPGCLPTDCCGPGPGTDSVSQWLSDSVNHESKHGLWSYVEIARYFKIGTITKSFVYVEIWARYITTCCKPQSPLWKLKSTNISKRHDSAFVNRKCIKCRQPQKM